MRVLYVINSLGAGGAEQSLVELLDPLAGRGIDVSVATLAGPAAGVRPEPGRAVKTAVLEGRGLPAQTMRLIRHVRRSRPDLIHTSLFNADIAGRVAGRVSGVPVLTSLVNTMYDPTRLEDPAVDVRKLRVVQTLDSFTARRLTDHFHAITHAVKDSCVQTMGLDPTKVTVVERGRDRGRLGQPGPRRRHRVREALELPQDAPVVVTVGRQEWQKAHTDLVSAFRVVAGRLEDAYLLIAGRSGHASSELELARRASGVADRIRVLGHRDDVADVLSAADVFAFPSRYEGLGGSVIEAMALGLPLVVSRIPALEEVVEENENAWLVDAGDVTGLADALAKLLSDVDTRRRFGERSSAIFEERFTLSSSANRMAALYHDLHGRHG